MTRKKSTETPSPDGAFIPADGKADFEITVGEEGVEVPQEPALPATVFVANLDADAIYWGVIEKHRDDLKETDVEVPKDCDLAPGKYRYNADPARIGGPGFDPLERSKQKAAPTAPTFEDALYALIRGNKAKAEAWADHYEKTVLK